MASVHAGEKAATWSFVFYLGKGKGYKWVQSDIKVDRSSPRNQERSKKRAEKALALYEEGMVKEAPTILTEKILFGDMMKLWLESHEYEVKAQSSASYKYICNKNIIPWFNDKKIYLQELKPVHLKTFFNEMNQKFSISYIAKFKAYIGATLRHARFLELIKFDPLENIELTKKRGSKFVADWYDITEMKDAIDVAQRIDEPILPAIFLSGIKGCRREEACAVQWKNINWKNHTLMICGTVIVRKGGIYISSDTKTNGSVRVLPLSNHEIKFLKDLQKRQEENKKVYGNTYDYTYDGFVCVWPNGKLLHSATVTSRWAMFVKRNVLKPIRFQDLRASFCTNMLRRGATPERVIGLTGHSDPATLLRYYARFCADDLVELVADDNDFWGEDSEENEGQKK